jgi:glycolate oxidase iron-sulfur subunit
MSSPRGRIYLMRAVAEGAAAIDNDVFVGQIGECLNCRACEAVCPSGVQYGSILEASRAQVQRLRSGEVKDAGSAHAMGGGERAIRGIVFNQLFKKMGLFRAFSGLMRLYQITGVQTLARKLGLIKLFGMVDAERMLPRMSPHFIAPQGQVYEAMGERRYRVALLSGCIMSTAFANIHEATIRVLRRNHCQVLLPPDQGCCGALHTHGGDLEGGRELARRNIAAFEAAGLDQVDAIIVNAAGCGSTLKEYGHLLAGDPVWESRAKAFAAKIKDVHEFLMSIPLNTADLRPLPLRVTYQEPCHLAHAQRITAQPRKLLTAIPQLQLLEMAESSLCCGSAGIYNITQPEMAGVLGARKVDNATATGADVVATGNPGCAMQLAAELGKRGSAMQVRWIVELLDEAYGPAQPLT